MSAAPVLQDVDPVTLQAWLDRDRATIVDVREADEYAREHIAGAALRPLSTLNGNALPREPGKHLVLMCNSGNRTRQAARQILTREPGELHHLEGGIQAWKKAGLPVEQDAKAPLPIMRQVQIAAGSLVLLGIVLALLVSPWFMALSAFVGAGLVFAGVSGFCGMARMLELLPYNR
jgi:rhodanese-related sulfurtransferase